MTTENEKRVVRLYRFPVCAGCGSQGSRMVNGECRTCGSKISEMRDFVPKQELTQAEEDIKRLKGEKGVLRIRKDDAEARERRAEERARVLEAELRDQLDYWRGPKGSGVVANRIAALLDSSTGSR